MKAAIQKWWGRFLANKTTQMLNDGVMPSEIPSVFSNKLLDLKAPYVNAIADAVRDVSGRPRVMAAAWAYLAPALGRPEEYRAKALQSWGALWGGGPANQITQKQPQSVLEECEEEEVGFECEADHVANDDGHGSLVGWLLEGPNELTEALQGNTGRLYGDVAARA